MNIFELLQNHRKWCCSNNCEVYHQFMSRGSEVPLSVILSVLLRFLLINFTLSVLFGILIKLCYRYFVKDYNVVGKFEDKKIVYSLKQIFSDTFLDSDDEEEDLVSPFLDHSDFYKNLNNSSQYLRRDSFMQ